MKCLASNWDTPMARKETTSAMPWRVATTPS